jgi:tetratricopeptide (TPR) repeat protein
MKVAESLATTMKELQVISNRLGLVYQEMGDFDSALLSHNRSLTLAKNLGDKDGEATDLVNIANILTDKEEYDKALAYYEESLNLQKDELKKGGIYNNIAGVYSKKNDHQTAIKYLNMAADIDERRGDHHALGIRFLNLAAAYVSLGDTENAWPTLERGLKMVKQVGDKFWEARGYEYLSVLSHHTGDSKTARQAAQKAFNLYSTIGAGRRAEEMKTWLTVLDKENIKPDKKKSRTR